MAAHNLKPPLLSLLLLASACASTDVQHEPRPMAEAAKTPAAGFAAPPADDEFAELESSLEAYEQQLASNEARLRAMGVLVATRDDNAMAEAEAPSRFAPPPPMTTPPRKPADLADQATVGGATRPTEAAKSPDPRAKDAREPEKDKEREKAKKRASRTTPTGAGKSGATSASSPAPSSAPRTDAAGDGPMRPEAKADESRGRCAELCDLADSTCDLEGKICDLAARHPGEARFAEVCRRADEDCRIAAEACTLCSP